MESGGRQLRRPYSSAFGQIGYGVFVSVIGTHLQALLEFWLADVCVPAERKATLVHGSACLPLPIDHLLRAGRTGREQERKYCEKRFHPQAPSVVKAEGNQDAYKINLGQWRVNYGHSPDRKKNILRTWNK
jgi:hypothetical protein